MNCTVIWLFCDGFHSKWVTIFECWRFFVSVKNNQNVWNSDEIVSRRIILNLDSLYTYIESGVILNVCFTSTSCSLTVFSKRGQYTVMFTLLNWPVPKWHVISLWPRKCVFDPTSADCKMFIKKWYFGSLLYLDYFNYSNFCILIISFQNLFRFSNSVVRCDDPTHDPHPHSICRICLIKC